MLGRLASWLRIFGFDAELAGEGMSDEEVILAAEGRTLLTCDKQLGAVLLPPSNPKEQLRFVVHKFNLRLPDHPVPNRCSKCNGKLVSADPPEHVKEAWKCIDCGQLFWEGSHWKKIGEFSRDVRRR